MGQFIKIVKKAQIRAKEELELREKKNQEAINIQDRINLLYNGWVELLEELIEEANQDIQTCGSRSQFKPICSESQNSLVQVNGFSFGEHRFLFESHREYKEELERKVYVEFICYYEKGRESSHEKQIIKAKDSLGPKPFTGPGNKPVTANKLSEAIQWWEMLIPDSRAG